MYIDKLEENPFTSDFITQYWFFQKEKQQKKQL